MKNIINSNCGSNSKATYLAYRSAWKAEYQKLSAHIRRLRLADRLYQRKQFAHKTLSEEEERALAAALALEIPGWGPLQPCALDPARQRLGARAKQMLLELHEAKQEAQRQYLARKTARGANRG
jgi:hypothetical protein